VTTPAFGEVRDFIDGDWRSPSADSGTEALNPATGDVIARSPSGGGADVAAAVDAASKAFPAWRTTPAEERIQYLFRLKNLLEEHFEEIARINAIENGKTCAEAKAELRRRIENIEVDTRRSAMPSSFTGIRKWSSNDGRKNGAGDSNGCISEW
jgi:malonate-semialdehyde dehydrogenase (acetylating)/methylmalonate-semialdehyde dehydrogenase